MSSFFSKTFGGLTRQYYFRNFIFGLIFPAMIYFVLAQGNNHDFLKSIVWVVISTFLYPYSRFVYESIVDFIFGDNIFVVNGIFYLFVKFLTMLLCWGLSIFIAPIGLLFLYYYHSNNQET